MDIVIVKIGEQDCTEDLKNKWIDFVLEDYVEVEFSNNSIGIDIYYKKGFSNRSLLWHQLREVISDFS